MSSLSDKINPVAIKELRQMVRSRTMIVSIVAFLLLEVSISLIIVAANAASSYPSNHVGETVFAVNLVLLAIVVLLLIPLLTFARVVKERSPKQVDLQYVTALTPYNFVNGKLFCSVALTLMFVFATLPVMSLSYLMRGVAISDICWSFAFCMVFAVLVNLVVIVLGSAEIPPALKWLVMIGGGFFGGFWSFIVMVFSSFFDHLSFDIDWDAVPLIVFVVLSVFMILWSLGVACFSSQVSNRFKAFKITYIIFEVVSFVCAVTGIFGDRSDSLLAWAVITSIMACAVALLMAGCKSGLSRRVKTELSKSKVPGFFLYLITTGAENGIFLAFLFGALAVCAAYFGSDLGKLSYVEDTLRLLIFILTFFGYLTLIRGIWLKLSRRFAITPILVPVVAVVLQGIAFFISMASTDGYRNGPFIPLDSFGVFATDFIIKNFGAYLVSAAVWFIIGVAMIGKNWFAGFRKEHVVNCIPPQQ